MIYHDLPEHFFIIGNQEGTKYNVTVDGDKNKKFWIGAWVSRNECFEFMEKFYKGQGRNVIKITRTSFSVIIYAIKESKEYDFVVFYLYLNPSLNNLSPDQDIIDINDINVVDLVNHFEYSPFENWCSPVQKILKQITLPFPLRDYQKDDINDLAFCTNCGLFNDLGLGKTVTAFMIACYKIIVAKVKGCYVLCPASLVTQWVEFINITGASVVAYRGTPKQRECISINCNFVVVSYQVFQKDYDKLKRSDYYFILDEATVFCNVDNVIYKMLQGGVIRKERKVEGKLKPEVIEREFENINNGCCLLTATPINKPTDAYGLISVKSPGIYRNYFQFERIHVSAKNGFNQAVEYDNMELLKNNLLFNAKRRLVSDHIDLPPIIYNTVLYDLSPAHQALYDTLIDTKMLTVGDEVVVDAIEAQAMYQACQKIIISPEIADFKEVPAIFDLFDLYLTQIGQFIVFSNYVNTNKKFMSRYKIGGVFGGVGGRDKSIDDFKAGLLNGLAIHPKSGGFGLNLQNCQNVFFSELPITPRDFRQSVGRCHRSGQLERVVVTVFVARNTIQETLAGRIMEKDAISRQVVNEKDYMEEVLNQNVKDGERTKKQLLMELRGKSISKV
jgi:SNF2 family DNA or RNA helicase